jgi:hypothetical protein
MEPQSARAFLIGTLRKAGRHNLIDLIRGYEKRALPPARYLTASELCHYLRRIGQKNPKNQVEVQNPSDQEIQQMDDLYHRWRGIELRLANQFEEEHPEVVPKTLIEEIHAFEDYACQEFGI